MSDFFKRNLPLLTLILLSPVIGELLSGSSPPLEFFAPPFLGFFMLLFLYGFGALIIRELSLIWKGKIDWGTILLLGVVYGIIEEGLAVKSFFDPNWMDLGNLGTYGRVFDVNWVWTFYLIIYHSIISIAIPIILFELIFPDKKNERLLTDTKLKIVSIIFVTNIFFIFLFLTNYFPNFITYLITLSIVISLFIIAWKIEPNKVYPKNKEPVIRAGWFGIGGLIFIFSLFIINTTLTYIIPGGLFVVILLLDLLLILLMYLFVVNFAGYEHNSYHKLTFASGFLSWFIFLGFIFESMGIFGMSLVSIFFIISLLVLRKKVLERQDKSKTLQRNEQNFCPYCGFHFKKDKTEKFCPNCGKEIDTK
ncbi:MAG: zinc ribbon domain-containing protein [Candidatus Helarchaeota archaeon]